MKIFGFQFGNNTPATTAAQDNKSADPKHQTFSTPLMPIGEGNLSQPFVDRYYTVASIVRFGSDNLYPQLLNNLYLYSPIHQACINFTVLAAVGGGYEFTVPPVTGPEKVDMYAMEKQLKLKRLIKHVATDWKIHRRITILICRNPDGTFKSMKRLDPSSIRHSYDCTMLEWSDNWARQTSRKQYPRYQYNVNVAESVYLYQEETPGQDVYAIPGTNSINNWAALDAEQAYLQKQNIIHSIYPSLVIRKPTEFQSEDEMAAFKSGIKMNSGAKGAGRLLVLSGNGMDNVPEVDSITSSGNDELFQNTDKTLTDKICQAHMINPSIMGVKVAGQLGNAQEIAISYAIFEKNVVMPMREELEEVFDELLDIAGAKTGIKFKTFQIIDGVVQSAPTGDGIVTLSDDFKKKLKDNG